MQIIVKNKDTLLYDEFKFKCSVGKKGISTYKKEGDLRTPKGTFSLGSLFYRKDKFPEINTNLGSTPVLGTKKP